MTSIGESAFSDCSGLTSVTIGDSVTSIGSSAFSDCSGLTSVTIPNSVTSIGSSAFENCHFIKENFVNNSSLSAEEEDYWSAGVHDYETNDGLLIDSTCVAFCRKYADVVTIPNSVTSIGESAFYNCSVLASVTIPNSVTSIGSSAFSGCSGLTSVTIPNRVTSIGRSVFSGCSGLTSVSIPNSVTSIGGYAFQHCSGLTSVTIPNSVTSIGLRAFSGCSGLTSVTIGNSVTSINNYVFSSCSALIDIYCYAENVPSTGFAFVDIEVEKKVTLHVPAVSVESYKTTAPWNRFGKIVALTEEETGIDELKSENRKVKTAVYDLSGRRVQKGEKGIFIQNGKVVLVR